MQVQVEPAGWTTETLSGSLEWQQADTTVFTAYMHKEGYENWSAHHLSFPTILKAMQQQAYHQLPECCVFITHNGNSISARIPRSPNGVSYTI
ncbi:hypothetical protein BDW60DRAFT_211478 [Aspergillus nidulans var. acristatus]